MVQLLGAELAGALSAARTATLCSANARPAAAFARQSADPSSDCCLGASNRSQKRAARPCSLVTPARRAQRAHGAHISSCEYCSC